MKKTWLVLGWAFLAGMASGQNADLSKARPVPAGERVAAYLQTYFEKIGTVVEAKSSRDLFGGSKTYRVLVVYDPDQQGLEVTVMGGDDDPAVGQSMLDTARDIILKLNPKLQKYFEVTLQASDLSMDYLCAKNGKVLVQYRDGKFLEPQGSRSK